MKSLLLIGIALGSGSICRASDSDSQQLAASDLARAMTLATAKDVGGAISAAKKAIEENPELLQAHEEFIKLTEDSIIKRDSSFEKTEAEAVQTLSAQYGTWTKMFPKSAGVQYGMGSVYSDSEDPRAKPYLLKAVSLDPKLAKAYQMLCFDAERWGNESAAREYMGKAAAAEPKEASYAFYYADFFEQSDPAKYKQLSLDVVKRFPDSERGAQALYWLGENSNADADKIAYWEQAKTLFPPSKFGWSEDAMSPLFDVYARTDTAKALALANEIVGLVPKADQPEWIANQALATNLVEVHKLLDKKHYAEAKTLLDNSKVSKYSSNLQMFDLLKAEATAGAGNVQAAYDALLARFAKTPEDAVHDAISAYGTTLGKTQSQIENDVWGLRDAAAKPAPSFDLPAYLTKGNQTLEDYKGKVVLLTFWFPGCGPCRGEFPHFERALKKFRGQNVAYVGINVLPSQDDYVKPFMKGTHYTFTPLEGSEQFAQTYHVRGEPTNFLIDQSGKVVYSNFRTHDPQSERNLQLMIQSLLDHHPATR